MYDCRTRIKLDSARVVPVDWLQLAKRKNSFFIGWVSIALMYNCKFAKSGYSFPFNSDLNPSRTARFSTVLPTRMWIRMQTRMESIRTNSNWTITVCHARRERSRWFNYPLSRQRSCVRIAFISLQKQSVYALNGITCSLPRECGVRNCVYCRCARRWSSTKTQTKSVDLATHVGWTVEIMNMPLICDNCCDTSDGACV